MRVKCQPIEELIDQAFETFNLNSSRVLSMLISESKLMREQVSFVAPQLLDLWLIEQTNDIVLRSAIVFAHASLESAIRDVIEVRLISQLPLKDSRKFGRLPFGKAVKDIRKSPAFAGALGAEVYRAALSLMMDNYSVSRAEHAKSDLRDVGIDIPDRLGWNVFDKHCARRHDIVHRADQPLTGERHNELLNSFGEWIGISVQLGVFILGRGLGKMLDQMGQHSKADLNGVMMVEMLAAFTQLTTGQPVIKDKFRYFLGVMQRPLGALG